MPLTGLTVVSLAINLPGPVAAARLTALGASVTTVLPPSGDPLQAFVPDWFAQLHEGQRLLTLDLKTDSAIETLHGYLAEADLLVVSSRTSALQRLGLDFATLQQRHPRLCEIAIVGHPAAAGDLPGHDLTYQADAGLLTPPAMPTTLVADLAGAERAVGEALAAVRQRDRTGLGVRREVALSDVAVSMAEPRRRGMTAPGGMLGGGFAGYAIYATADGYVALAALEPHFVASVERALGVPLDATALTQAFAAQPSEHWVRIAADHDVPLTVVE